MERGLADLIAAVGTAAATLLAVWQAGGAARERHRAARAEVRAALWSLESALAVLEKPQVTYTYMAGQCGGVLQTLLQIPVAGYGREEVAKALIDARAALHVIVDRAGAARASTSPLAKYVGFGEQVKVLEGSATTLRQALGLRPDKV